MRMTSGMRELGLAKQRLDHLYVYGDSQQGVEVANLCYITKSGFLKYLI